MDSYFLYFWICCRVTDRKEDLFIGNKAPELPNPDSLNETLRGFCLCDGTERCGRKAVSDTTADDSEPQQNVLLGVPVWANIFNRRKKREASTGGGDASTGNPRTYYINYKYDSQLFGFMSTYVWIIAVFSRWEALGQPNICHCLGAY